MQCNPDKWPVSLKVVLSEGLTLSGYLVKILFYFKS